MKNKVKFIDFKVVSWERIYLTDSEEMSAQSVIDEIKNGLPFEEIPYSVIYDQQQCDCDIIQLMPQENDGQSTVEMYDDEGNMIWSNEIKPKE